MQKIELKVNDKNYTLKVEDDALLLDVLREDLGLTGTKRGCEIGECGACTVIMDGQAVNSCLVLAAQADGSEIRTIEGVAQNGKLHPVQQAFIEHDAVHCGFCTPGMVMSAINLLEHNSHPEEQEIRRAISGNLCRCTGYTQIVDAIKDVAAKNKEK